MNGVNDTDEVQSTIDKKKKRMKKGVEVEPIEWSLMTLQLYNYSTSLKI